MTDRLAESAYPLHDLLAKRWSPRAFSERTLEPEALGSLFEAARWAPSSFNEQPWGFLVGERGDETHKRISELLVPPNREWAAGAPLLLVTTTRTTFTRNGKRNAHAEYDLGAATALLTVQAQAMGLVVHQMAGFDSDGAASIFALPEGCRALTAVAIGYHDAAADTDSTPRSRKPLTDVAYASTWGSAHAIAEAH